MNKEHECDVFWANLGGKSTGKCYAIKNHRTGEYLGECGFGSFRGALTWWRESPAMVKCGAAREFYGDSDIDVIEIKMIEQ